MKVLVSVDSYFPGYGGPFTAISDNLRYLYKNKINFKLIYQRNNNFKYKLNLREIISDYDIIHVYGIWRPFLSYIPLISLLKKKKIVISTLGALEPWSLKQKRAKKYLAWHLYQKRILNNADIIHATSDEEKKHLVELGIKTKIIVLKHGVKVNYLSAEEINRKVMNKAIFFSRIHPKKGLLELINSWKIVNNLNWNLEIYGPVSDQKYLNKIKNKIKKLNLDDQIKIFEPVYRNHEKKKIFLSSDIFILTSQSENFGISIAEALSFGVPVFTTDKTPWEKIINKYKAGFVIRFHQDDITNQLKKIFELKNETIVNMRKNALKVIKENFDYNFVIDEYIKMYKSLIK